MLRMELCRTSLDWLVGTPSPHQSLKSRGMEVPYLHSQASRWPTPGLKLYSGEPTALRHLITGGAGFIGTNLASHYLAKGHRVTILDNFSRAGSERNAEWLRDAYGDDVAIVTGDVRQPQLVSDLCEGMDVVYHEAAQVAVTTSVTDPRTDFEINALGTFNVLEAVRQSSSRPIVVYASTNKVYGEMTNVDVIEEQTRYRYDGLPFGVPESRPLDFHSPYGCSKGSGDQYVTDYARIYGLRTVVFRQSCIYGPHQFGIEDQGWLAWFVTRALDGEPITIYGDGKQVRDVLYVTDLIAAYDAAIAHIDRTAGRSYNIGGGPGNTLSLLEFLGVLERYLERPVERRFADFRQGDQFVYISDIRRAKREFEWEPQVSVDEGVTRLIDWLVHNRGASERLASNLLAG